MRQSRESELLELLSFRREGFTWRELLGIHRFCQSLPFDPSNPILRWETGWPRKTLDRHLKSLIERGIIEKIMEPREDGERGRRSTRYRISPELWHSWGCMVALWPAKRLVLLRRKQENRRKWEVLIVDKRGFLGEWRKRAFGRRNVHLFQTEARKIREYRKSLGNTS